MRQTSGCVVVLLAVVAGGVFAAEQRVSQENWRTDAVGVYHWDGVAARGMYEGVQKIVKLGVRNVRVTLSPRYYSEYHRSGQTGCYPDYSLPGMLGEPDIRKALAHPQIRTVMITAYDGVTWGDCGVKMYMVPGFFTQEHTQAVEKEYSDFVFELVRLNGSRGKRFIISNWESDNDVYCGSVYMYTQNPDFQSACDANYSKMYGGNEVPSDSISGFRLWFSARSRGIEKGILQALAAGNMHTDVWHAPEFNSVWMLPPHRFPTVLRDVIPFINVSAVSYSAYESIAKENPTKALLEDFAVIAEIVHSSSIIVGEAGFQRFFWKDATVSRTEVILHAAFTWGVPYFFQWNLYDQSVQENLGLYDLQGRITPLGRYYKKFLKK